MRVGAGVVGLCVVALVAGGACGSSSSKDTGPSSTSRTPGPTLSSGTPAADYATAVGRVKHQWGACLTKLHESTSGAKMAPASTNPLTGRPVRQDFKPFVIELSTGEQFLVELDPGGSGNATLFNKAARATIRKAKAAGADCG